jgi:hypothetical protein
VDSVNWAVVVPILISILALGVSLWTKWSERRLRTAAEREAERARRSADLMATAGGSTFDYETSKTTYTIRLHNAGQMSAGDISIWAELRRRAVSEERSFPDLAPDSRAEATLVTEHHMGTPLDLRAQWTDGIGTRRRTLMLLDPFS